MTWNLLIAVRFHEGRYHGRRDGFSGSDGWPPSPARLFQALVASAAEGAHLRTENKRALRWMEELDPPEIVAPSVQRGRTLKIFVPNNDLDAVGGDPSRVSEIRVGKQWRPCFFDVREPILYVWQFDSGSAEASRICAIAERLCQLGRGIDAAWAEGQVLKPEKARQVIEPHAGTLRKPRGAGDTAVPQSGTLDSLIRRYERKRKRLTTVPTVRKPRQLFAQPPKASFRKVGYDTPPRHLHFELRTVSGSFAPRPLASAASLIASIRDAAAGRLQRFLPEKRSLIDRLIVGRDAGPAELARRIRIVPVPSIGTSHTDPSLRRIMVEGPVDCPMRLDDLKWAFSGLEMHSIHTGERLPGRLVTSADTTMADRFGRAGTLFRSITPAALPRAQRQRIGVLSNKTARERGHEERKATQAVASALRHAGVNLRPIGILVRKEPFHRRGLKAEDFAKGSRFNKHALWHLEMRIPEAIPGPLLIGDGRFCGLGLMEPILSLTDVASFQIGTGRRIASEERLALIRHFRRALMALARDRTGNAGRLFSGHAKNGSPARSGVHDHVFLAADDAGREDSIDRLVVAAPWACDRRAQSDCRSQRLFQQVIGDMTELRAGYLGRFERLAVQPVEDGDPLIGPSREWTGRTPYVATRNLKKRDDPVAFIKSDLVTECARRGLPMPVEIGVSAINVGPKGGLPNAELTLKFAVAVRGPLILGRDSHVGGGLFHALS